jgi:hypothetical protein
VEVVVVSTLGSATLPAGEEIRTAATEEVSPGQLSFNFDSE